MKTKTVFILLTISAITLSSCFTNRPVARYTPVDNKTYSVAYLFEHDGCKVYRFNDLNNTVYFTNCRSDVISITSDSTQTRTVNRVELKTDDQ